MELKVNIWTDFGGHSDCFGIAVSDDFIVKAVRPIHVEVTSSEPSLEAIEYRLKMRSDAVKNLADRLAAGILQQMEKHDTYHGYPLIREEENG